uniref:Myelin basic protein n=1 Tax=Oncorhynchus mykiss TaxID=8022 RepID=A0A8K9X5I0_ONCMY
ASAATDSTGTEGPSSSWNEASTADADDSATPRPHLVRLFSRDAPGREDNTFKDRPSESDELQTIQEHSGAGSEFCFFALPFSIFNTPFAPGLMDQIGNFFGGDKKRKSKVRKSESLICFKDTPLKYHGLFLCSYGRSRELNPLSWRSKRHLDPDVCVWITVAVQ